MISPELATAANDEKKTVLHVAWPETYRLPTAKLLAKVPKDLVNARDAEGKTVLHFASQEISYLVVPLLSNFGANANIVDSEGLTHSCDAAMKLSISPFRALMIITDNMLCIWSVNKSVIVVCGCNDGWDDADE